MATSGRRLLSLVVALGFLAGPLFGGTWEGRVAGGFVGQDESGSEESFRTQTNLDSGFTLRDLDLRLLGGEEGEHTLLEIAASGFGAEPWGRFRLEYRPEASWDLRLDYDRRESFFALAETNLGRRSDDWEIDRWRGRLTWDGWRPASLELNLRYTDRSGTVSRPLRGLNEIYLLRLDVDETMQEVGFKLETRTLPVHLMFEQAFAIYERSNGRSPGQETALVTDDPDLFADAEETRDEEREVSTSRLVATWRGERAEMAGSVVYSPAELDGDGIVSETFAVAGGTVGSVSFLDDFLTSADQDRLVGDLRLAFDLGAGWGLRLEGDYQDSSTDAELRGERIVRIISPTGFEFDLPASVDERSVFDVTDSGGRVSLEYERGDWSVWGGGLTATRDVEWRRSREDATTDVSRDTEGWFGGVSWSAKGFWASAEYEHGSFDELVFPTDPETVDRLDLKLRGDLAEEWSFHLRGRFEESDNPAAVAGLDHSSDSIGGGITWSPDAESSLGLEIDSLDLHTETGLVLPTGVDDVSIYDLSLLTVGLYGQDRWGPVRVNGSVHRVDDSGNTWPLESWTARTLVGYELENGLELGLFGEYWEYDEDRAEGDDFDVTRYGLNVGWRFQ
ncbi:MAG: hypothetical protein R3234_07450 [Thermoanaerobaculia bacterium]|nr:hypothetical protein [Thermoanaerobaculia bacterium]